MLFSRALLPFQKIHLYFWMLLLGLGFLASFFCQLFKFKNQYINLYNSECIYYLISHIISFFDLSLTSRTCYFLFSQYFAAASQYSLHTNFSLLLLLLQFLSGAVQTSCWPHWLLFPIGCIFPCITLIPSNSSLYSASLAQWIPQEIILFPRISSHRTRTSISVFTAGFNSNSSAI